MDAGLAGCLVLGHAALVKVAMTLAFRGPGSVADSLAPNVHNWMQVKDKLAAHPTFAIVSASQLNEAEYAPLFCAALFFCKSQGIDLPVASALAVAGQVCYFWPRWMMATPERFNVRALCPCVCVYAYPSWLTLSPVMCSPPAPCPPP